MAENLPEEETYLSAKAGITPHDWSFVSGAVAAAEESLIGRDFFERLLEIGEPERIPSAMGETRLRESFSSVDSLSRSEEIIESDLIASFESIRALCPDPLAADILLLKYEYLNLKRYLKEVLVGLAAERSPRGKISDGDWERAYQGLSTDLPPRFYEACARVRLEVRDGEISPYTIDLIIDSEYLNHVMELSESLGSGLIENFFREQVRLQAVDVIWRTRLSGGDLSPLRTFFLYGRLSSEGAYRELTEATGEAWDALLISLMPESVYSAAIEGPPLDVPSRYGRAAGDYLMQLAREARLVTFGMERAFGYLFGEIVQAYNLKVVLGGIYNRVNRDLLRERIRDTYV